MQKSRLSVLMRPYVQDCTAVSGMDGWDEGPPISDCLRRCEPPPGISHNKVPKVVARWRGEKGATEAKLLFESLCPPLED